VEIPFSFDVCLCVRACLCVVYETSWPNVSLENDFTVGDITGIAINSAGNIIVLRRGSMKQLKLDMHVPGTALTYPLKIFRKGASVKIHLVEMCTLTSI